MPLNEPTGINLFCCCPDCMMFEDNFDCCFPAPWPLNRQIEMCDNLGRVIEFQDQYLPCCLDQDYYIEGVGYVLSTKPTQDLGPWWEGGGDDTGWWKAISPDPQYTVYDWICNDGALYSLSPGAVKCKVGWHNTGYQFMVDMLDLLPGTDITYTFFNPKNADQVLHVNVAVSSTEILGGYEGTVSSPELNKSMTFTVPKLNPMPPGNHSRIPLTVAINGQQNITCISLTRGPSNIAGIFECKAFDVPKFSITTNSSVMTIFDNVYWGRQFVWDQLNLPCPTCAKCVCYDTDQYGTMLFYRPYGNWKMKLEVECLNGALPPTHFRLEVGFKDDTTYCQVTGQRWYTDPIEVCNGGPGNTFMWEINCLGSSLNWKEYVLHLNNEGQPQWVLTGTNGVIIKPNGFSCKDDKIHQEFMRSSTVFTGSCLCMSPTGTYTFEEIKDGEVVRDYWEQID